MNNEKGLSLIEVLGSIAILGIAVLGLAFILQQGAAHTKSNERKGNTVQLTRNVMEEIKENIRDQPSVTVFGQSLPLAVLRDHPSASLAPLYYPSQADKQYEFQIKTSSHSLGSISLRNGVTAEDNLPVYESYNTSDLFRYVVITCRSLASKDEYELAAYVAYQ